VKERAKTQMSVRWLFLILIFGEFNIRFVRSSWPISNSSSIQILGLFIGEPNASNEEDFIIHCRAMFKSAILLAQQYELKFDGHFLQWRIAHTNGIAINALSETCHAISNPMNTIGIVGPALSRETPVIADFGNRVGIPVVSYAATDPNLSDQTSYPAFHRTVPSDNAAALAIVQLFLRYNWSSCVFIYQNDAYGLGGLKAITEAFMNTDLVVQNTVIFDIGTQKMRDNLQHILVRSSTRIVLVWVDVPYASLVIQSAIDSDVIGPSFMWILSSAIPLDSFNKTSQEKLIGMLTIEPTIANVVHAPTNTTLLNAAYAIWQQYEPNTFPGHDKVDNYALFAFDATWTLIQSLQQLCSNLSKNSSSCISFIKSSSSCFDSDFVHSNLFFNIIDRMKFLGVSGSIEFVPNTTDRIHGNYYFAQNCRLTSNGLQFVPVLNYSNQYGWQEYSGGNVIVWPGGSFKPPNGIAKLEGVKLRIGIVESFPYTSVQTETLIGYMPEVIERLRERMKFIPIIQTITMDKNQSYGSLVELIENGHYDIIIGDVTITKGRREIVSFSNPIFDNCLRIITRKTDAVRFDLFLFVKPFSRDLWISILFTIYFASCLLCLVERSNNEILRRESRKVVCAKSVWYVFGHFLGAGVDFRIRTTAGRLITIGLHVLCIILVQAYTANLASELTRLKPKHIISGIDDIKRGLIRHDRIGIRVDTAIEDFYLREISAGIRDYYPLRSRQVTYGFLLNNEIDVALLDIGVAEYMVNNVYFNLTLVGECYDKSSYGILTPKNWLYAQDLDVHILALRESGVLDDLKRKWFQTKTVSDSADGFTSIGMEGLGGLFIIFAGVCFLALVLIFAKYLVEKRAPLY